jgi:hypothetical protein
MKKHISYPEIGQFRNICSSINRQSTFEGMDEAGEPIYNPLLPKPVLTFKGTVKLHGTNAGVSYNYQDGLWAQSRENIITPEKDNAGFAFFVEINKNIFNDLIAKILISNNIDSTEFTVSIFGEWAGKGIQKSVGIANIDKSFFIFGAKISKPQDEKFNAYWVDSSKLSSPANRIYNIEDFETYNVEIDFNMPQLVQNKLIELTLAVEDMCPIAKELGFEGTGEGIVFLAEYKGIVYRFKSKGEKHSISKVKVLNSVDTEKLESIAEFIEYAVTENRFNQAIEKIFVDTNPSMKGIADVMRWVVTDIIKEESDTLAANGLEPKDIGKYVSNKVRPMFFDFLNKQEIGA